MTKTDATVHVYDVLVQAFVQEGVDTCFALLGDANMNWAARLADQGCRMIYVRHEHCAVAVEHIAPERLDSDLFNCLRLGFQAVHIPLNDLQIAQPQGINRQNRDNDRAKNDFPLLRAEALIAANRCCHVGLPLFLR